jgi:hypothetical protein
MRKAKQMPRSNEEFLNHTPTLPRLSHDYHVTNRNPPVFHITVLCERYVLNCFIARYSASP